jgi:anti-sigma factor RsiW
MGMECDRQQILLYVEGELGPEDASRLRAHVAQCAPCRAALEEEQDLASALGGLGALDCPDDFASATVTKARCDLTHAVSNPRERGRAILIAASLSGLAMFLLWPTGVLDPVVRALGPLPCISRCVVAGLANTGMSALMVGRVVSRHVFERNDASNVALLLLLGLVALLGVLLRRYYTRGVVGDGNGPR